MSKVSTPSYPLNVRLKCFWEVMPTFYVNLPYNMNILEISKNSQPYLSLVMLIAVMLIKKTCIEIESNGVESNLMTELVFISIMSIVLR